MKRTLLVGLLAMIPLGCEPWSDLQDYEREEVPIFLAEHVDAPAAGPVSQLKVMSYNFKFGGGRVDFFFDYWGDRATLTVDEVERNMQGLWGLVNEVQPDVLIAQEIDVDSKRTAYIDQLQTTLDNTDLNYAAFFESWDTRYAPDEGFGRVLMGNVIFSRYPITRAERIRSADRSDQAAYEAYFLIHRALGRAEIKAGERSVVVYDIHAAAYDSDGTKKKHVEQALELVLAESDPVLIGGDFNNIPPTSLKREKFNDDPPDAIGTRFESPPYDLDAMQGFYDNLLPAISLQRYGSTAEEQAQFFTHTIISRRHKGNDGKPGYWNRKIDYLFVKPEDRWLDGSTDALQAPGRMGIKSDPMELSDHCPTVGTWEFGS